VAHRVFAAKDGYVAGGYSGPDRMWRDLLSWLSESGEAGDLTEERWQDPVYRWRGRSHVDGVVAAFIAQRTVEEISREALARALPWAPVTAPYDLTANPQLQYRDFFVDIQTPAGPVRDVGFPYASPGLPRPVRLAGPREVDAAVEWTDRETAPVTRPATPRSASAYRAALHGVRVLDLTWVLAGPYMTKILGEHGADIVKVESVHRPDPTRFAPSMRLRADASPDESGYFLNFNRNKRSLALNLRTPQGVDLLQQLVATVDVVVENFSPGVLERWGLGYQRMREINPDVVLVSMAGVGQTGPWRPAVTFADTLAAMSGLTHETAGDGRPPQGLTFGLGDMVAANAAALAALEMLYRGHGGHIDLSQLEAMAAHLGPALAESTVGAAPRPAMLPRVLRTLGEDRWIAVGAVEEQRLAAALTDLTGQRPAADPVAALAAVAAVQDADRLTAQLQQRGIPAYPVRDGADLVEHDAQLAAGGFYVELEHPLVGRVTHEGIVVHLHDTPGGLWEPAPVLGQHTDELLTELLGLRHSELVALHEKGVLT
jgi:crotonobetainyl-CoA:carnitine CoA-transferase CaiB-like acyl-CoA transferase